MEPGELKYQYPLLESFTQDKGITRRKFLVSMGLAAAGLALPGCQPNAARVGGKPAVAIAKADLYDRKLVRKQVEKMLDSIGGLRDVLAHGNRVAIKTNLTGGTSNKGLPGIPEIESYLTHPEVVRAIGELLRDAGVKDLYIVEAVYEKESWSAYGYEEIAKSLNAPLIDLNESAPYQDYVNVAPSSGSPMIYEKYIFNPILAELDAFVSVSKMKCHNTAGVTHSMKNLFGLVPYRFYRLNSMDASRSAFHNSPTVARTRVPNIIIDLNRARPVTLSIIDGIMTTEAGEGPWISAMKQIKPGLLFAGKNPVATDAVATAAMGFDPMADFPNEPFVNGINHLNIASKLGMGPNDLAHIKVVGEKLGDVTMKFKPSY